MLQLGDAFNFGGLAAGFGDGDQIDLRNLSFARNSTSASFTEAGDNLSGTLTVTNGAQVVNLTLLGQYVTGNVTVTSDGHGGTPVSDPPVSSTRPSKAPPPTSSSAKSGQKSRSDSP